MLELQADYYVGIWAHQVNRSRQILESGDIEEGLNAASAIPLHFILNKALKIL